MTSATDLILQALEDGPTTVSEILDSFPVNHPIWATTHPQGQVRGTLRRLKERRDVEVVGKQGQAKVWQLHTPERIVQGGLVGEFLATYQHDVDTGNWLNFPPYLQEAIERLIMADLIIDPEVYE